jgi:peptide chain release factor 1
MLRERLAEAIARADDVERMLADPEIARDPRRFAELGREHHRLAAVVDAGRRLERAERELGDARELAAADDPEMAAEARAEAARLEADLAALERELKPLLIPRDPLDDRPAIVEVRAGTGGDEAALFAADLVRMYTPLHRAPRLARRGDGVVRGDARRREGAIFKVTATARTAPCAGSRACTACSACRPPRPGPHPHSAHGRGAPEAEEVDVRIEDKDLRIDVFRSSGPAGRA